jgi:5-formyltetrahydrofolate cyclo-ligase
MQLLSPDRLCLGQAAVRLPENPAPERFAGRLSQIGFRKARFPRNCLSRSLPETLVMTAKDIKKALRTEALGRRDALEAPWRIEASLGMSALAAESIDITPGDIVSGFLPIRSEADLRPTMAVLRDKGARLCLPVILDRQTIVFRELVRGAPLVDTGFGTSGPGPDAEVLDPTVMLVPLSAFDGRGHRIGYGAGHYDRAIARLHARGLHPRLIGIAFTCQQVDHVPDEPHDVPMPHILTESGLLRFANS